jgi:hypothetical protein
MRALIALALAASGVALAACAAEERPRPVPDAAAQGQAATPDAVAPDPIVTGVRRRYCQPQPWCRWSYLRGPHY